MYKNKYFYLNEATWLMAMKMSLQMKSRSTFEAQSMKKSSSTETELKKKRVFGILVVKIYIAFLFWKKNDDKVLTFNTVQFPNFEISALL